MSAPSDLLRLVELLLLIPSRSLLGGQSYGKGRTRFQKLRHQIGSIEES
jgi:hypothetical protein